jgi:hypothetical protein
MKTDFSSFRLIPLSVVTIGVMAALLPGCGHCRPSVTAVPLSPWNQCEPPGIPYYLPKPLLVVAKNVRHIDESKVGLTNPAPIPNTFDNQATYGDIKANVTVPGKTSVAAANAGSASLPTTFDSHAPTLPDFREKMTPAGRVEDGLSPDSFYTYQIVFVPDLSQKYGLRLKGGPGEIRAAMNLVNGWMYTGMGPYYLKDSSRAQNIMALGVGTMFAGRGVADVLSSVGDLAKVAGAGGAEERATDFDATAAKFERVLKLLKMQEQVPATMLNYAEICIYEPEKLEDGSMGWKEIAHHTFDRQYFQVSSANNQAMLDLVKGVIGVTDDDNLGQTERSDSNGEPERSEDVNSDSFRPGGGDANNARESNSTNSSESVAPAPENPVTDQTFIDVERQLFGLPPKSDAKAPAVQIEVTQDNRKGRWWEGVKRHVRREPPKVETKTTRYFDLNQLPIPGDGGLGANAPSK